MHLPPPSRTLLLNDRQRWWNLDHVGPFFFFLENTPHDQSHVGMPGVKSGWGMSAIVSASASDIHPLRLRGSSSCWRHVLWFTTGKNIFKKKNKMLRVSCEQTWWFTSTDDGSEGPPTDSADVWGMLRIPTCPICGCRARVFWLTGVYQYLTSSSHIISTGSTSFSSGHGLFHVVHDWKGNP